MARAAAIMRAPFANVAQLAEHRIRNANVVGSNPTVGSSKFPFKQATEPV